MTKDIRDAVADTLAIMYPGLNTFGKPFNDELVLSYLMGMDGCKCEAQDVLAAGQRFLSSSRWEGAFPASHMFREEVERQYVRRWNREHPMIVAEQPRLPVRPEVSQEFQIAMEALRKKMRMERVKR